MINPATGGYASEAEIRIELGTQRIHLEAYKHMDAATGGPSAIAQRIIELERVLEPKSEETTLEDATYDFLRKNPQVKWHSGSPTWDHYELVDGEWVITTYTVAVSLANPTRRHPQPAENY
jgi:hypothetical protein